MDADERRILAILFNTNKTIYSAKKSNMHRIKSIETFVSDKRLKRLKSVSVDSLNEPLDIYRDEIYKMLMFSREYTTVLSKIPAVDIYDATELIVEIGDIRRFKKKGHFISYSGLSPISKKGGIYSKINRHSKGNRVANKKQDPIGYRENLKTAIMRCTKKLVQQDTQYKNYYNNQKIRLKQKNPMYHHERINSMALKKASIKFANFIYNKFNEIADLEEYEKMEDKYNV